jgi:hypothetical protein
MSERLTLIITLELAIARASAQRRAEMALQMTELFIRGANIFTDDLIDLFDEIITMLAIEIDGSVLAMLSQRLAPIANAPVKLARLLANDDDIRVAYPVLARCERLDDATLVRNAQSKSQKHLLAISWRKSLSESITDVLLKRGNKHAVLSTTKNSGARFSEEGFRLLVNRSESDDVLGAVLGSRPDILTLITAAPEPIRLRLIANNQHIRQEIDRLFVMIADDLRKESQPRMTDGRAPQRSSCEQPGQLTSDGISSFVGNEDIKEINSSRADASVAGVNPVDATRNDERRELARQKSFLRGYVYFNNRRTSVECHIRDLSKEGARILISTSVNIPDTVELYIPQRDQTVRAYVRWRRSEEIGLSFSEADANSDAAPSGELTQRVTQLESEIGSLRELLRRSKSKSGNGHDSDAA